MPLPFNLSWPNIVFFKVCAERRWEGQNARFVIEIFCRSVTQENFGGLFKNKQNCLPPKSKPFPLMVFFFAIYTPFSMAP